MPLPPATAFRPWPIRAANALLPRAWATGVLPMVDLREATLDEQARRQTGLSEFGDDAFARAQLRVLLPALRDEAALHPFGRLIAHGSLLKVLKERLWARELFTRHPEILARPVAPPVVIVGQMRSGTTRVQRLLACDPRFATLRLFEAMCPVPWPSSFTSAHDPRIAYTRNGLRFLNWINPGIGAVHPADAMMVDEELGLFEHSFAGAQIEAQRRVPSFARWCETHDQTPAYAEMRQLLQLAGWFRGDPLGKPWLLKTPQHMQDLPALLAVFPDARLIFTHRNSQALVPSGASLAWQQMVVQSDAVDPRWIGREWLHKTAHRAEVVAAVRPTLHPRQAIDLHYDAVAVDWRREMARVYAWLGWELPPGVLAAMQNYGAAAASTTTGHRYDAADFGLTPAMIDVALECAEVPTRARAGGGGVRGDSRRS